MLNKLLWNCPAYSGIRYIEMASHCCIHSTSHPFYNVKLQYGNIEMASYCFIHSTSHPFYNVKLQYGDRFP
jgi:hypothetical protein